MATQITARKEIGGVKKEVTCSYDFGESLQASVEKFNENVVHSGFIAHGTVYLQGVMRKLLEGGKSPEDIQAAVTGTTIGVARSRQVDHVQGVLSQWNTMDKEARDKFIKELQARSKK